MKAITTKHHGPNNIRGARISASDSDGNRVYISYPFHLSGDDVYKAALAAFLSSGKWKYAPAAMKDPNNWIGGWTKTGMVWVCTIP